MRFLKNKIRLAEEAFQRKQQLKALSINISPLPSSAANSPSQGNTLRSKRTSSFSSQDALASSTFTKPTKNIVINYGKAIFSFASSDLAKPYIERFFLQEKINLNKFHAYLTQVRPKISGYKNFELLFIVEETDSVEVGLHKRVLAMLGQVFIKYFSVNWITHGKVAHKMVYLKHRFEILRRIAKF